MKEKNMEKYFKLLCAALFALTILGACSLDFSVLDETPVEERIFSTYTPYNENYLDNIVKYKVTHVMIDSYSPNIAKGDMTLGYSSVGSSSYDEKFRDLYIPKLKKLNPEIKVLMSLRGWHDHKIITETNAEHIKFAEENYAEFSKPENVEEFVASTLAKVNEIGFDGVDIKITGSDIPSDIDGLVAEMVKQFSAADKLVTAALSSRFEKLYPKISKKTLASLDFVNVMSYDYSTSKDTLNPINCASLADYNKEIDYWHYYRGLPLKKMVMGVPYHAQAWFTERDNTPPHWSWVYENCLVPAGETEYYIDDIEAIWRGKVKITSLTTGVTGEYEVAIDANNPAVMKEKATIARKLGGIMATSFGNDIDEGVGEEDHKLSKVISDTLFAAP